MHRPEIQRVEGEMILATGAILAGLGVAAGAFGAHMLRERLGDVGLNTWRTATSYQMYHALALIVTARMLTRHPSRLLRYACWLYIAGTVVFSGSLYLVALDTMPGVGILTPLGGLCLLAAWACVAVAMVRSGRS